MKTKTHLALIVLTSFLLVRSSKASHLYSGLTPRSTDKDMPDSTITINLDNIQNKGYYLTINVGSHKLGQHYNLKVDTGSPWIWIPDIRCKNCFKSNTVSHYYNCTANSATCYQRKSKSSTLEYLQGNITGLPGTDTTVFGNYPNTSTIKNCSLYFATKITEDFYDMHADGILGLGLNGDENGTNTFLDILLNAGLIQKRAFSTFLTNDFMSIDEESKLILGGYDQQYLFPNETFNFFPTILRDGWSIGIRSLDIGSVTLVSESSEEVDIAILSTVFPDIGVPPGYLNKIIQAFADLNISCSMVEDSPNPVCEGTLEDLEDQLMPNITLSYNGTSLVLPASAYTVFLRADKYMSSKGYDYRIVLQFREFNSQGAGETSQLKWVLGASFLRYFYILYDQDNLQIGFARANHEVVNIAQSSTWFHVMLITVLCFLSLSCCFIGRTMCKKAKRLNTLKETSFSPYTSIECSLSNVDRKSLIS